MLLNYNYIYEKKYKMNSIHIYNNLNTKILKLVFYFFICDIYFQLINSYMKKISI